jgi:hypothetical protein
MTRENERNERRGSQASRDERRERREKGGEIEHKGNVKRKEERTQKNRMPTPIRSAQKRCTSRSRGIQTHLGFENRETKHLGGEKKRVKKVNMKLNTKGR